MADNLKQQENRRLQTLMNETQERQLKDMRQIFGSAQEQHERLEALISSLCPSRIFGGSQNG